jgi:hypothetical protein
MSSADLSSPSTMMSTIISDEKGTNDSKVFSLLIRKVSLST